MTTFSFTKQMNFNEKETKELFDFLESENKSNYKVKTPTAKKHLKKYLKRFLLKERNNGFC